MAVDLLGPLDLHLINEGRHERLWTVLGAHPAGDGVAFAVWAPNAREVRVAVRGGGEHPLEHLGVSGVWRGFAPGAGPGSRYLFRVLGRDGVWRRKADPLARQVERRPGPVCVVASSGYAWRDGDWLRQRARREPHREPMSVFEVHLASWRPGLSYVDLADELVRYVLDLGFTHVEFMPVAAHPYGGSWGYQVTGYFAPDPRLGGPDGLRHLVDRMHRAGIGVILDWVPAHFPKDEWALARFDGTALYEHPDPRRGEHPDWGTAVFDFGRPEVRNFLVANALYWLEEFHVDGLRVDAVASMLYLDYSRGPGQWLPNADGGHEHWEAVALLRELNTVAYRTHPGIVMIAEESTAWPGVTRPADAGGLGFGFKWDLGWMHDTLGYLRHDPIRRHLHHHALTFPTSYAGDEQYLLPLSHDEVVHGKGALVAKMPGEPHQRRATVRALLAQMWAQRGKQLVFMGAELGLQREWSEADGLDWAAADRGMHEFVRALNRAYRDRPALWSLDASDAGFTWIGADDAAGNTYSFQRTGADGSVLVCVLNFAGRAHDHHRVGLPRPGVWRELLNSDDVRFGGAGDGNQGGVRAQSRPWQGRPASAVLRIPALSALWLVPESTEDG